MSETYQIRFLPCGTGVDISGYPNLGNITDVQFFYTSGASGSSFDEPTYSWNGSEYDAGVNTLEYTGNPIGFTETTLVKVIAIKSGYESSDTSSGYFEIANVPIPSISIPSGAYLESGSANVVTISGAASDLTTYYTFDGTAVSTGSYGKVLSGEAADTFLISPDHIIQAFSTGCGYGSSDTGYWSFNYAQVSGLFINVTGEVPFDNLTIYRLSGYAQAYGKAVKYPTVYTTKDGTNPLVSATRYTGVSGTQSGIVSSSFTLSGVGVLNRYVNSESFNTTFSKASVTGAALFAKSGSAYVKLGAINYPLGIVSNYYIGLPNQSGYGWSRNSINTNTVNNFALFHKTGSTIPSTSDTRLTVTSGITDTSGNSYNIYTTSFSVTNNLSGDFTGRILSTGYGFNNNTEILTIPITQIPTPVMTSANSGAQPFTSAGNTLNVKFNLPSTTADLTTGNVVFYYSVNGRTPSKYNTSEEGVYQYSRNVNLNLTEDYNVIKILATKNNYLDSEVYQVRVYKESLPDLTFNLDSEYKISITGVDSLPANTEIYFTDDGQEPDNEIGILYEAPIAVLTGQTIKAIAYNGAYFPSAITEVYYNSTRIESGRMPEPTIVPHSGAFVNSADGYGLIITGDYVGADFYYETGNTEPSAPTSGA
jgi:hypothetical protein